MQQPQGFTESAPGIFRVAYDAAQDMVPEKQASLVSAIRTASEKGPVGLVFVISDSVRLVDLSVPTFWSGVVGDKANRIAAMAMVTHSTAVRVAAFGFSAATSLRGLSLAVEAFHTEDEANVWAKAAVSKAAAKTPAPRFPAGS